MAKTFDSPFDGGFPAHDAATGHADAWPETDPQDIPDAPDAPLDLETLPDDAPPVIDLVTGLPNPALSAFPDDLPEETDDGVGEHFPGFLDLFF